MNKPCSCEKCVGACSQKPGWFAPGQAERAAKLLGMPWEEFKAKFLIREYWEGDGHSPRIYVWSPRQVGQTGDTAAWGDAFKAGPCVFLKEGRCQIHSAKPFECRHVMACDEKQPGFRPEIRDMWAGEGNPLA